MENKLNIAELLKDCPSGMELDCAIWDNCTFEGIEDVGYINILVKTPNGLVKLSKEGYLCHNHSGSKCVIFPKDKTTWEGFQRPFKDGDVVVAEDDESFQLFLLKYLTHSEDDNSYDGYCYFGWNFQCNELFEKGKWGFNRLATEEEKQKLFQAIKDNGYRWNSETKTLEKLVEPKFKVGDRIRHKQGGSSFTITEITDGCYKGGIRYAVLITQQDNFELVPDKFDITTLEPYQKVLFRQSEDCIWLNSFFGFYDKNNKTHPFICCNGFAFKYCIPYEKNEHLLGTTNDCDEYYKTW